VLLGIMGEKNADEITHDVRTSRKVRNRLRLEMDDQLKRQKWHGQSVREHLEKAMRKRTSGRESPHITGNRP